MEKRFTDKVMTVIDGCHLWTAATNKRGYGKYRVGKKMMMSHRYVIDAPDDMDVHHACSQASCVNPEHLVVMDPDEHQRLHTTDKTHCLRGHEYAMVGVYRNSTGGRYCRECARLQRILQREPGPGA